MVSCVSLLMALSLAAPANAGVTVALEPDRDNTLIEDPLGAFSNGSGPAFFAGRNSLDSVRRGLIHFDIAAQIPTGSTVESATLTLRMTQTSAGAFPTSLHRALSAWGESTSSSGGGSGDASALGDATWLHTFFDNDLWTAPGGDFDVVPAAATIVDGPGLYTWNSVTLAADVQSWLDDPAGNFGWLLKGDETTHPTTKRFHSREAVDPAHRPELSVVYSAPVVPEPGMIGSVALLLVPGLLRRRGVRRRGDGDSRRTVR